MRPESRWVPVGIVAALILLVSVTPVSTGDAGSMTPLLPDYVSHGVGYAVLAGSVCRALESRLVSAISIGMVACGLAVTYGVGIEALQAFVPSRSPSVSDVFANAVGTVLGALAWRWAYRSGSERFG